MGAEFGRAPDRSYPGDFIWWTCIAEEMICPGELVSIGPKRCRIEIKRLDGTPVRLTVSKNNVKPHPADITAAWKA